MPDDVALALLADADRGLVRAVDGLDEAGWAGPSLLPGWTRAHVLAHLALNAEALLGVVEGVLAGQPVPMYPSQEQRDADIAELAAVEASELQDRLLGATTRFGETAARLPDDLGGVEVARVPGGQGFPASGTAAMRLREVAIHHADLDVGYTAADWPAEVATRVLDFRSTGHEGPGFTAFATDVAPDVAPDGPTRWVFGDGGPTVSGPLRALAWWSTGRGDGDGLTSDDGRVPRVVW